MDSTYLTGPHRMATRCRLQSLTKSRIGSQTALDIIGYYGGRGFRTDKFIGWRWCAATG